LEQQEKNIALLRTKGIQAIDVQIERLRADLGVAGLMKYNQLTIKARSDAAVQLDIVLDCALQAQPPNECALKNLDTYAAHDVYIGFFNTKHPCFGDLLQIMAGCFAARITAMRELIRGQGAGYDDLVRSRFATPKEALSVLRKELAETTRALPLVEENPTLLMLPFGIGVRKVLEALEDYLGFSACSIADEIDRIYSPGGA
jgi:hypothetical protein